MLPVPGGDKEWYLYAARAGLLIGVANHRRDFQPQHDRPCRDWDKPARAAIVFIHNGAPSALVGCLANNFLGRPDRALELADKAIRLSPRDPFLRNLYHIKGWAFFMKRQDDQAIEWLRRAEGGTVFTDLILAAALALTGQQADAHETLKRYLAVNGVTSKTIAQLRKQQLSLADNSTWVAYNERLFDGLRKAGLPEE